MSEQDPQNQQEKLEMEDKEANPEEARHPDQSEAMRELNESAMRDAGQGDGAGAGGAAGGAGGGVGESSGNAEGVGEGQGNTGGTPSGN